jgi:hypothetical protein
MFAFEAGFRSSLTWCTLFTTGPGTDFLKERLSCTGTGQNNLMEDKKYYAFEFFPLFLIFEIVFPADVAWPSISSIAKSTADCIRAFTFLFL